MICIKRNRNMSFSIRISQNGRVITTIIYSNLSQFTYISKLDYYITCISSLLLSKHIDIKISNFMENVCR